MSIDYVIELKSSTLELPSFIFKGAKQSLLEAEYEDVTSMSVLLILLFGDVSDIIETNTQFGTTKILYNHYVFFKDIGMKIGENIVVKKFKNEVNKQEGIDEGIELFAFFNEILKIQQRNNGAGEVRVFNDGISYQLTRDRKRWKGQYLITDPFCGILCEKLRKYRLNYSFPPEHGSFMDWRRLFSGYRTNKWKKKFKITEHDFNFERNRYPIIQKLKDFDDDHHLKLPKKDLCLVMKSGKEFQIHIFVGVLFSNFFFQMLSFKYGVECEDIEKEGKINIVILEEEISMELYIEYLYFGNKGFQEKLINVFPNCSIEVLLELCQFSDMFEEIIMLDIVRKSIIERFIWKQQQRINIKELKKRFEILESSERIRKVLSINHLIFNDDDGNRSLEFRPGIEKQRVTLRGRTEEFQFSARRKKQNSNKKASNVSSKYYLRGTYSFSNIIDGKKIIFGEYYEEEEEKEGEQEQEEEIKKKRRKRRRDSFWNWISIINKPNNYGIVECHFTKKRKKRLGVDKRSDFDTVEEDDLFEENWIFHIFRDDLTGCLIAKYIKGGSFGLVKEIDIFKWENNPLEENEIYLEKI